MGENLREKQRKGEDEVVLVNEQKMLTDKDQQPPLVCAVSFSGYTNWHQRENKRCCRQQAGCCPQLVKNCVSGHKQQTQTQPHDCTETVNVPSLYNDLRRDLFSNDSMFFSLCTPDESESGSDAVESEGWNVLFYSTSHESLGAWQIITRPHP